MRNFSIALLMALIFARAVPGLAAEQKTATLYKNPQCICCEGYAKYLRESGYSVTVKSTHNLPLIKKQLSIPKDLEGCHTTVIGSYVVEGHVPVPTLNKLLSERPDIKGISLPGMPEGSPGMTGKKTEDFQIYEISKDTMNTKRKVYAVE